MTKYYCDICDYKTNSPSAWTHHKTSKKHLRILAELENIEKDKKNKEISELERLKKDHEISMLKEKIKTIKKSEKQYEDRLKSQKDDYEDRLKILQNKFEDQIRLLKDEYENRAKSDKILYENQIEILKIENNYHKQLINSAGGIIKKSVNTLSFLLTNYNDAPGLDKLSDYSIISKNMDYLIKDLVFYYKEKKLDKYFGDFLVRQYKKDKPELQALWSSDTDRLNYFIKELIDSNSDELEIENNKKESQWTVDRKGLKMTKCIINPLLDYICKIATFYLKKKDEENQNSNNEVDDIMENMQDMEIIGQINWNIKNGVLSNNINKYIAPYFYLDKNKAIMDKKDKKIVIKDKSIKNKVTKSDKIEEDYESSEEDYESSEENDKIKVVKKNDKKIKDKKSVKENKKIIVKGKK